MSELIDPRNASIDGLIDWLRERRVRQPTSSLAEILSGREFAADRLVDLACIDLMQRRRMGHSVSAETYLQEFPTLDRDQHRLDLIDAELCICAELGQGTDVSEIVGRFPDLADPIRELMQLDGVPTAAPPARQRVDDTCESADDSSKSDAAEFSLQGEVSDSSTVHSVPHYPVEAPEWFTADKCVASGQGHWLVRGRDSVRGDALAMKIIELPAQIAQDQGEQILNACEKAAKVRNAAWIIPSLAAIQHRHLAVIRPWVFAPNWEAGDLPRERSARLRDFASVAFTIQSAHDVGAAHGAIHAKNLIRDHDGKTKMVDAVAGLSGLRRWLPSASEKADTDALIADDQRKKLDVQDLIKLVAAASVEWEETMNPGLLSDLRTIAGKYPGEASGRIGELLIKSADAGSNDGGQRPTWRKRLAQWFAGD